MMHCLGMQINIRIKGMKEQDTDRIHKTLLEL